MSLPAKRPLTRSILQKIAILVNLLSLLMPLRGWSAEKKLAGDDLFAEPAVRHLRIEIPKEGLNTLSQYTWKNRKQIPRAYVHATVHEGAVTWTNVAIHLKGAYGSFRSLDDKPGLTLKFDEFVNHQHFHGLQKISLNNSVQDPSYLSHNIASRLFAQAGVPTPRVDYATVELNGRYLGLYLLVEGWNKQFLKRHFKNVQGNFYDFGGAHDIDKPTLASFGNDPTNHSALAAVVAAAKLKDHSRRISEMRKVLDMDRFLSMAALDTLIWNWDGYANNKNNYRSFVDLDQNRVVLFPHGIDMTFSKADAPIVTGRAGLIMRALMETTEGRNLYLNRLRELRTNVFNVPAILELADQINERLRPVLAKDGTLSRQQSVAGWYRTRIREREEEVDAQLAGLRELLQLGPGAPTSITNWTAGARATGVFLEKTTDQPLALHIVANDPVRLASWQSTLWLEEGQYRLEARLKTSDVQPIAGSSNSGAGLRVWSTRKISQGPSWSWLPLEASRDPQLRGLIPVMTNTVQKRLAGNTGWTTITHDFDLRQPIADLEIQCVIENATGSAWFDASSLRIQRRPRPAAKPAVKSAE
jgi:spore coat protein H